MAFGFFDEGFVEGGREGGFFHRNEFHVTFPLFDSIEIKICIHLNFSKSPEANHFKV